jgi:tRNA modification GTPase
MPTSGKALAIMGAGDLIIRNKSDLISLRGAEASFESCGDFDVVPASTMVSEGLQAVRTWLERRVSADLNAAEPPFSTRARHEEAITAALAAIERAVAVAESCAERAVEDLRQANHALRSIVGELDREAVLDRVFGSFCIGK